MALFGDLVGLFNLNFPLTSSRYTSMTEDYRLPMESTFKILGTGPDSLEEGIKKTVEWLPPSE